MKSIIESTQKVHLMKQNNGYFGTVDYNSKPMVFAFPKFKHVDNVMQTLRLNHVNVQQYSNDVFKVTMFDDVVKKSRKHEFSDLVVENHRYLDAQVYLTMNNVGMFVVNNIIEDDDANLYLVSTQTTFQPVLVNNVSVHMNLHRMLNNIVPHPFE